MLFLFKNTYKFIYIWENILYNSLTHTHIPLPTSSAVGNFSATHTFSYICCRYSFNIFFTQKLENVLYVDKIYIHTLYKSSLKWKCSFSMFKCISWEIFNENILCVYMYGNVYVCVWAEWVFTVGNTLMEQPCLFGFALIQSDSCS